MLSLNKLAEILQNADVDDLEESLEEKAEDEKQSKKKKTREKWKHQTKFVKLLKDCKHPSKTKVRKIAEFAVKQFKWYKTIVYLIKKQMIKMPEKQSKLALLFIIDAICRLAKQKLGKNDNFRKRFTPQLKEIFSLLCKGPSKDRGDIKRVVGIWKSKKFFPSSVLNPIIKKTASFPDSKKRKRKHSDSEKKKRSEHYDYGDQKDEVDIEQLRNRRRNEEQQRRAPEPGEPARKRRRISVSPQASPAKHVSKKQVSSTSKFKNSYDSTLGGAHMVEHVAYQSRMARPITPKGYLITQDQNMVPSGFVRVMSTTLWLGRRDMDDRADQTIKKLVEKFGDVHDVSFREDHVFVKYQHRDDASRAHKTLIERLVGSSSGKKFTVGWGKPPKVKGPDFDFDRGIGLMSLEEIKNYNISAPQTDAVAVAAESSRNNYSKEYPFYQDSRTRRDSPEDTRTQTFRGRHSPVDPRTRRDSRSPERREHGRRSRSPRRNSFDRRDRSPSKFEFDTRKSHSPSYRRNNNDW